MFSHNTGGAIQKLFVWHAWAVASVASVAAEKDRKSLVILAEQFIHFVAVASKGLSEKSRHILAPRQ